MHTKQPHPTIPSEPPYHCTIPTHRRRSHPFTTTFGIARSLAGLVKPHSANMEQEAGPSAFKTPQNEQTEWTASSSSTTTPSRQTFPRRLSLLQNDSSSFSSPARDDGRRTSFTGPPKPLSLGSQSVTTPTTTGASGFDTPRRGKRTSLSYISSPSTSFKANDDAAVAPPLSRAPSTSSASGRTRTGSISRTTGSSRRRPSQASDADDWLMSEDDTSFSLPSAARAMAERDSAKVEAQFHDVRPSPFTPLVSARCIQYTDMILCILFLCLGS